MINIQLYNFNNYKRIMKFEMYIKQNLWLMIELDEWFSINGVEYINTHFNALQT